MRGADDEAHIVCRMKYVGQIWKYDCLCVRACVSCVCLCGRVCVRLCAFVRAFVRA